MKKISVLIYYLVALSFILRPENLNSSIVDTPEANLKAVDKEWLLDHRQIAKQLYQAEIETALVKEIPAFNVAFLCYSENNVREADKFLNLALKSNPQYGPALLLKGIVEYNRRNLTNCYRFLRQAIKYHPAPEIPCYYLGKFLFERGKIEDATEYLNQAIAENKLYTLPYALLGDCYLQQKKFKEAIEILEKGFKYSYDAEIIYQLARAYRITCQKKKSLQYYGLFKYLFPQHPAAEEADKFLEENQVKEIFTNGFEPIPDRSSSDRFFPIGENVLYSVYWGIIRVGELNTEVVESLKYNGNDAYKVRFSLDSNPALEFIASLHSDYITIIDQNTKQTYQHYLHIRENKINCEKVYDYLRSEGIFKCRTVNEDGHIDYLEKYLPVNTIDGTSILFYARQLVKEHRSEFVLTTIDENFVVSVIDFDQIKEPVMVRNKVEQGYLLTGENRYKGIVGFTGKRNNAFINMPDKEIE
jgi:tetratricopeptide (TPR) repeat protein